MLFILCKLIFFYENGLIVCFLMIVVFSYPYNISKSTLSNVGAMSCWPNALGALMWLANLARVSSSIISYCYKSEIGNLGSSHQANSSGLLTICEIL